MLHYDVSYQDTWARRNIMLNGMTYSDYLNSDHWAALKSKIRRRKRFKKCMFCPSTSIEPHHKDYKWIFTKDELRSIIPVCRKHHQEIHDLAGERNVSVRLATNAIIAKYEVAS